VALNNADIRTDLIHSETQHFAYLQLTQGYME